MYGSTRAVQSRQSSSAEVAIYMAGDVSHAKQIVRRFCMDTPTCVTVTPTTFIYRGGEEEGFVVAFRNYPRFPSDTGELKAKALALANMLRAALGQRSYMIDDGKAAEWSSMHE